MTAGRGAMAEVAGKAALLVDPEDVPAMARGLALLAGDAARRAEMVARGRENAAIWTWERTAQRTLDVYHSLLHR